MQFYTIGLCLAVVSGSALATTLPPKGHFTLQVSVFDLIDFTSESINLSTSESTPNSAPELWYASYLFDSSRADPLDYWMTGNTLFVEQRFGGGWGAFTYDFATAQGQLSLSNINQIATLDFTNGGGARYVYEDDEEPRYLYETASFSTTRVAVVQPIPVPAGLVLMLSAMGAGGIGAGIAGRALIRRKLLLA